MSIPLLRRVARILKNSVIGVPPRRSSEVVRPTWRLLSTCCLLLGNHGLWTQKHQVHLTFLKQCVVNLPLSVPEPCLWLQFSPPMADRIVCPPISTFFVGNMSCHLNTRKSTAFLCCTRCLNHFIHLRRCLLLQSSRMGWKTASHSVWWKHFYLPDWKGFARPNKNTYILFHFIYATQLLVV